MTELDEPGRPEPPRAGDENATLLGFLEYQRATLSWRCGGLDRVAQRTWPDGRAPSMRWIGCHTIEE